MPRRTTSTSLQHNVAYLRGSGELSDSPMARGDVPSFLVGDPAAARDLNHLEARLRMPTDATVAKNRVASCDPINC